MPYINFSNQEKETANTADIVAYLTTHGETVKRAGREYMWQSPAGKVSINGSQWYSQYEQIGGGAIQFVRKYYGKSFPEAVQDLLGYHVESDDRPVTYKTEKKKETCFVVPPKHTDMRRVYGYLLGERCLDREVVSAFAHAGLLYEEPEYHNVVFLGIDQNGIPRHAQKRSTVPVSDFKNNVEGSNADFSFHWDGTSDKLYVFEAPIDMLAYISLHKESWQQHSYVALCSTADRAAIRMLRDHENIKSVYLCLDHDSAGIEGAFRVADSIRSLRKDDCTIWRVLPTNKDWDEDLKAKYGKTVIAAGNHEKMEFFLQLCEEVREELNAELPLLSKGETIKKYRFDSIFKTVPVLIDRAERSGCNEQYRCMKEAGKTLLIGALVNTTGNTVDETVSIMRSRYQPHRDYDNIERLLKDIRHLLSETEGKVSSKDAFTQAERQSICRDFLWIACDCFRQCGAIERSSQCTSVYPNTTITQ